MCNLDIFISWLSCFQPIVFGLLIFIGIGKESGRIVIGFGVGENESKFFECATYYRGGGGLGPYSLGLCLIFVIFDIDVLLLFPEVGLVGFWAPLDYLLGISYIMFFVVGVWWDYSRYGYLWI